MVTTLDAAAIASLRTVGIAPDAYGPTINTARSPRDVDIVGEAVAAAVRARAAARPQALVIWDTSDESVLAHAVARCLGIHVLRAFEIEGRLGLDRDLEPGAQLAVLATRWNNQRLAALSKLIPNRGGRIVVVAAVLGSPALAAVPDAPTVALVSADEAAGFFS